MTIDTTASTSDAEVRAEHVVVPMHRLPGPTARLSFDNGVERLSIAANAPSDALIDAHFAEPLPVVWTAEHGVHVEYPPGSRMLRRIRPSSIGLNPAIPWSIDVHGGAAHLGADLRDLTVHAVSFHAGAAHIKLRFGRPNGQCTIRVGSVSSMRIERPANVPVRLELASGAANLRLDDRLDRAVGGGLVDQTPGWDDATSRLLVIATAGVNELTVDHRTDSVPLERSRRNHPSRSS